MAADSGADAHSPVPYSSGQEVGAFFRSNDHPEGHRYVKVKDRSDGFPLIGLSAGWLQATVVKDFDPVGFVESDKSTHVHVHFSGTFRDTQHGHCEGLEALVHPSLVRRSMGEVPSLVLSLFGLRWWDYWSNSSWSDRDVTSDSMIMDIVDGPCGVDRTLPGEYELHTAWVKSSQDLTHISGDEVRALLRAPHISAWLFLWPTRRLDADKQPGCVCEFQFFALCQRMERAGIPTGWPHIAYLYRQLAGKFWVPQMCLHPDYKVPATTRVHYAEFAEAGDAASERAIGCLLEIRGSMGVKPHVSANDLRGVVKLGFSWQGQDVLPFRGVKSLSAVLNRLFTQPESNQIICVVQEMVPDVICELRVLCFHDGVKDGFAQERLWVRMGERGRVAEKHEQHCDVPEFALASSEVVDEDAALEEFFGGSRPAMKKVVEEASGLVEAWLCWFSTECPEPPQATRLDFLISHSQEKGTSIWTCGVNECGSSLCGIEVDARNAAVLNGAMRNDDSGRFPKPLPPIQRSGRQSC